MYLYNITGSLHLQIFEQCCVVFQSYLEQFGYLSQIASRSAIDYSASGGVSQQMMEAIRDFQRMANLPETGMTPFCKYSRALLDEPAHPTEILPLTWPYFRPFCPTPPQVTYQASSNVCNDVSQKLDVMSRGTGF